MASVPWDVAIREMIESSMCERYVENNDYSFITLESLQVLWAKARRQFQEMQAAINTRFDNQVLPFSNYIKVLSIFVAIGFKDWRFVGELLSKGFKDAGLPFKVDSLRANWLNGNNKERFAGRFVNLQYAFCPICIKEGKDLPEDDRLMRFPFVEESQLGAGGFGTVTKVRIAKGYLMRKEHDDTYVPSTRDIVVARKKFRVALHGQLERDVLDRLRQEAWNHDCIMPSFASVNLGSLLSGECEYNLFFRYAPSDLQKFLNGERESHRKLGVQVDSITPQALFEQLLLLLDALRYLHREELRMCHSDLKLDNILIVPSDRYLIGQWKITDFGIASIEPRPPRKAQGIRDLMNYSATISMRASDHVPNEDQRVPGPFQPPEVEFPKTIPDGTRYRAKGDIWSLGCIAIYVLAYAISGPKRVQEIENVMCSLRRDPGRQGYFYDVQFGQPTLVSSMVDWVHALSREWDSRVQNSAYQTGWVQQAWNKMIKPMLTVPVQGRATAQSLWQDTEHTIKHLLPWKNVWDVLASYSAEIPEVSVLSQAIMTTQTYGSRKTHTMAKLQDRTQSTSDRAQITYNEPTIALRSTQAHNPKSTQRRLESQHASSTNRHKKAVSIIPEELNDFEHSSSHQNTYSAVHLPSPPTVPLIDITDPISVDISSAVPDECYALQIADNGNRVLLLTKAGVKCVSREVSELMPWRQEHLTGVTDRTMRRWGSLHLAGPCLLLQSQITAQDSDLSIQLYQFGSTIQDVRQEWNSSIAPDLTSVTMTALSCKGHVALRSNRPTRLALYDRQATRLFAWDLADERVDYPPIPSVQSGNPANVRGNIEAMAFDVRGEYLVVTAWNCWFLWALDSLTADGTPSRCGRHSYTPFETAKSKCSLQILPGGRYFLLHDQYHQNLCVCVDTFPNGQVYELDLQKTPKPGTLVISPDCDWLAYVVKTRWPRGKDHLYYHTLSNMRSDGAGTPGIRRPQEQQLAKIRTVTIDHESILDAVVQLVVSRNVTYAIVASVTRIIEIIPLRHATPESERRSK